MKRDPIPVPNTIDEEERHFQEAVRKSKQLQANNQVTWGHNYPPSALDGGSITVRLSTMEQVIWGR
jgi:hypothetical protein